MTSTTKKPDEFDVLLDSYLGELMEMSDKEVLDGDDPAILKDLGLQLLDKAKAEAGRLRLQAAKQKLANRKSGAVKNQLPEVSLAEAKAFIRSAANDPRFTMAARGLDEMSNDDIFRLYEHARRLKERMDFAGGDGT